MQSDHERYGRGRPVTPAPLLRDLHGAVLRAERLRLRLTLAEVADRAGLSVAYLSEIERGRKEASSEMLADVCGALDLSLPDFLGRCGELLERRRVPRPLDLTSRIQPGRGTRPIQPGRGARPIDRPIDRPTVGPGEVAVLLAA